MSTDPQFVHLHVHTHYSLLDGATRINELVATAKRMNMPAVAITDHGNLFGVIEFYEAARKAGIKPIVGCELYLAEGDRRCKDPGGRKEAYHLLVLATSLEGYRNLMRLSSIGYTEGFYRKPRIDKNVLRDHSEGLICTSTCLAGEIPQALLAEDGRAAEELAKTYLSIFGPERFFIELQDHGMAEQRVINPELIDLARRLGVGTIATNDVHYLVHGDVEAHDVLCCINTGSLLAEEDRFKFPTDQFHFKSPQEMVALFPDQPEALSNTLRIADMCDLQLDFSTRHAPVFQVPGDVVDDGDQRLDDAAYLRRLVLQGASERYGDIDDELRRRIDYELDVICSKGFASYFLIVWDFVHYAKSRGIPCSARGSGCSSVVAYCLHISAPDPIRYGLYFERFMDPDRDEMPDIDIDMCQSGRAEVIEYVRQKYGHVAQIITFGTLKAKAAIKDVARVTGMSFERANKLTKLIPNELKMTIDKALDQEPELKALYKSDAEVKRIVDIGRKVEGLARNSGIHAAGVVVADQPMVDFLPLCRSPGGDVVTTQYDGLTVEKIGLLKMDFLGLRTLTTLERARQLAQQGTGKKIDLDRIDLTDQRVYDLFARGDTKGVFQFESGGMRDVVMRMRPNRIEDLIAANALYRPGPMAYIDPYISRKHGESWTTPHPIMTEVLSETYGIMVYQEQVSRLVNRLGGIELKQAFRLAKAISKKKTDTIEKMREPFQKGCEANGVSRRVSQEIFENILKFGGYAFNKAHSTGYAIVAFQTAHMKTYHPVEFMAALMTFEMSDTDKIAEYREACRQMGISIDPPDVNRSDHDFTVSRSSGGLEPGGTSAQAQACGSRIVFGLGAIKGLGAKAIEAIIAARREGGGFRDLFDFCERVDLTTLNRASLEALICAGAFDRTGTMRKAMFEAVEDAVAAGQRVQQDRRCGQMNLFGEAPIDSGAAAPKLSNAEWNEAEMLAREKAVLGFYVTKHPLVSHETLLDACATATTADLKRFDDGAAVILGGMVSNMRTVVAKGGRRPGAKLGIVTLEDLHGQVEAIVFPDDLEKYRSILVPDAVVFLDGEVDRKREEPSLRVKRVIPASEALEGFGQAAILRVAEADGLEPLLALVNDHHGPRTVYLEVPTGDGYVATIECGRDVKVKCSEAFLTSAAELLGHDAVRVVGSKRRPIPWRGTGSPAGQMTG